MNGSPFHDGERAVQRSLGLGDRIERFARQAIRPYMPAQHRAFFEEQPFLVMAARDAGQRPWVTLLTGEPGFVSARSETTLTMATHLAQGDPLAAIGLKETEVGLLGIELDSRRRNRVNGKLISQTDGELRFETKQSFGNCPQYITERRWVWNAPGHKAPSAHTGLQLTSAQAQWIQTADTFFIGTGYQGKSDSAAYGMDASHRGGAPGFVEVINAKTLAFPDYSGNNHFNTIGNLVQDSRVGLLFVNFEQGHLLQITGTAQLDWQPEPSRWGPEAQRVIQVSVDQVIEQRAVLPFRWEAPRVAELNLRLVERKKESEEITSFLLESAEGDALPSFTPGQHLAVRLPGTPKTQSRTYSLSSAPNSQRYRISVKREDQGFVSRQLHEQLQLGDLVTAGTPAGSFVLQDTEAPVTLVSAGVGITPMLSMLEQLAISGSKRRITFVHGARNGEQQAFALEVQQLVTSLGNARTQLLLSQPNAQDKQGQNYDGVGRVSAAQVASAHPSLTGDFYLCGPMEMLADLTAGLTRLGVHSSRIYSEQFGPAAP